MSIKTALISWLRQSPEPTDEAAPVPPGVPSPYDDMPLGELADLWIRLDQTVLSLIKEASTIELLIKSRAIPGEKIITPAGAVVSVVESFSVTLSNPDKAREVLGDQFDDLVSTQATYGVSYKPLAALKALACDGDNPVSKALAGAMTLKSSLSISYKKPVLEGKA